MLNKRVDERVELNIKGFLTILKKLDPKKEFGLKLNMHLLKLSVEEYFNESDLIKDKHNIKFTNVSKRMSLTMHCIIQHKPIMFCKKVDNLPVKILLINEIYAFILGVSHHEYRKCFRDKEAVENFLYLLHQKCIDPEAFAIVINIFDRVFKECKEIENAS